MYAKWNPFRSRMNCCGGQTCTQKRKVKPNYLPGILLTLLAGAELMMSAGAVWRNIDL